MVNSKSGFNKIDLILAIAILFIAAVVVLSAFASARAEARDAKRVRDVRYIQEALQLYFNDNFEYPSVSGTGQAARPDTSACAQEGAQFVCYMPDYPYYPRSRGGGRCLNYSGYAYSKLPISEGGYRITFCLDSEVEGLSEGPHQVTARGIN